VLPIHTIVHPTDFSERSANALQFACALARDYGARVVVLHVAPTPVIAYGEGVVPPEPGLMLQEAKGQLERLPVPDERVRVERRFAEGDAAAEILRAAGEVRASLIVMGTHGRTGLGRLLMGSVAEQVVRRAHCPVLTVTTPLGMPWLPADSVPEAVSAAG
jgi:nucleotide-binding universal stress UspA family protein